MLLSMFSAAMSFFGFPPNAAAAQYGNFYRQPATATAAAYQQPAVVAAAAAAYAVQPIAAAASTAYPVTSTYQAAAGYVTRQPTVVAAPKPHATQPVVQHPVSTANYGFEAALYNAASSIIHQKQQGTYQAAGTVAPTQSKQQWPRNKRIHSRSTPQPQQLFYCDVCKISCAGQQTYQEHLEGQRHKKKEASSKAGVTTSSTRGGKIFFCELCDVTCTSTDTFNAHVRGAKHQKVMKLHYKLGKPIPHTDLSSKVSNPKVSTPKMNFTSGGCLNSATGEISKVTGSTTSSSIHVEDGILKDSDDPEPVGNEYIEEFKSSDGKIVQFHCKLCDCKFNDPNAKDMHLKGRRHRIQYKKKVNPSLVVDYKPSYKSKRVYDDRGRKAKQREYFIKRHAEEMEMKEEMRRMEEDLYFRYTGSFSGRKPESYDDRHIMAKHQAVYASEEELKAVQDIVSKAERALKTVSDKMAEEDSQGHGDTNEESNKKKIPESKTNETDGEKDDPKRILKGVMRIGLLAKGLLLKGDKVVELAVLCRERPTKSLLDRVFKKLSSEMNVSNNDKFEYSLVDNAIILKTTKEPCVSLKILFTSPLVKEDDEKESDEDYLSKDTCLTTLAELRHAKWFQARANNLPSCVIVIRIMRDLVKRVPSWNPLRQWTLELLVEKALSCSPNPLGPGDALRRVFECISSGVLLENGSGLSDPCEKETTDVTSSLKSQEREDITASAQHALRLLAFKLIHKVLGIEPLPSTTPITRKRRREDGGEDNNSLDKKDKKDEIKSN